MVVVVVVVVGVVVVVVVVVVFVVVGVGVVIVVVVVVVVIVVPFYRVFTILCLENRVCEVIKLQLFSFSVVAVFVTCM